MKLRWCDRRYVEKIAEHLADTSQDRFYHAPPYPTPKYWVKRNERVFPYKHRYTDIHNSFTYIAPIVRKRTWTSSNA